MTDRPQTKQPDFSRFSRFELPGFEFRDGWLPLVHELLTKIDEFLGPERTIVVDQVKEKMGSLRFYWHSDLAEADVRTIRSFVVEAERESAVTCEHCGKRGTIRPWSGGFYQANCVAHAREAVLSRRKPPNGPGWWLATRSWTLVDPATGHALTPERISEMDAEARAFLDAHLKGTIDGADAKTAEIFGARMSGFEAAAAAREFMLVRFLCEAE